MVACAIGGAVVGGLIGLLQLGLAGMLIAALIGAAACAAASRSPKPGIIGGIAGAAIGAFFGGWWEGPLGGGYIMQVVLAILGGGFFSWICNYFSVTPSKLDSSAAGKADSPRAIEDDSQWFED